MAAYASYKKKEDEYIDLLHHPQKREDEVCLHPRAMQRQNVKLKACLRCEEPQKPYNSPKESDSKSSKTLK